MVLLWYFEVSICFECLRFCDMIGYEFWKINDIYEVM